jgi:hypothetical protein
MALVGYDCAIAGNEPSRRMLLSTGARLHKGFAERFDHCSLAMLDRRGMVVAWYDDSFDALCAETAVLQQHVSQFYLPSDIATGLPGRCLRCALDCGIDTQQGWRRRPGGAIYWGTTIMETIETNDGRVLGFAHVTRRAPGPWEAIHVAARRPERRWRTRTRMRWRAGAIEAPSLAAP